MKPFVKWVGGKSKLLPILIANLPQSVSQSVSQQQITRYIEPFIGGGSVLLNFSQRFNTVFASDINTQLVGVYNDVKYKSAELIEILSGFQSEWDQLTQEQREPIYYHRRDLYNSMMDLDCVMRSALFIFLNKTCFNGLYRVNSKGKFNAAFGTYKMPQFYDESNIIEISNLLQKVDIGNMSFERTLNLVDKHTFVYLDPPYRPLNADAIAKENGYDNYSNTGFGDKKQIMLSEYAHEIDALGGKVMISNSDPHNTNPDDDFFENLYGDFRIQRISAARVINCDTKGRSAINELLITNY